MSRIFDLDGPVMRFLTKFADLMILNICTLIGCIPIFTIGASLTGMHYVLLKMVRGQEAYIIKDYIKSFKENFRQATVLWLIFFVIGMLLFGDFYLYKKVGDDMFSEKVLTIMTVLTGAVALVVLMIFIYVFPVLSHFVNTIKTTLRNSLFMAILNFPKTILMVIVTVIAVAAPFMFLYSTTLFKILPIYLMLGLSLPGFICANLYSKFFERFEPKEEKKKDAEIEEEDFEKAAKIIKADDVVEDIDNINAKEESKASEEIKEETKE